MDKALRVGVVLLREVEDHTFLFAPFGIDPDRARTYLSGTGHQISFDDAMPPWSDFSDARIAAAYCIEELCDAQRWIDLFAYADDIRRCASTDELLDSCDVMMLVNTADEGEQNRPLVEASLRAGKPTYVDKQLAPSLPDAMAMLQLAEQEGVLLSAASLLLTAPKTMALCEQLADEPIERVVSHGHVGEALAPSIHPIAHLQLGVSCRAVTSVAAEHDPARKHVTVTVTFADGVEGQIVTGGKPDFALEVHGNSQVHESSVPLGDYRAGSDTMLRRFFDAVRAGQQWCVPAEVMLDALVIWRGGLDALESGQTLTRQQILGD